MAMKFPSRVKETTSTVGANDAYVLTGAITGFKGFSASGITEGHSTVYCCTDGVDFEIGVGWMEANGTLSRIDCLESSNAESLVNWGSGEKEIFVVFPANLLNVISSGVGAFSDVTYRDGLVGNLVHDNSNAVVIGAGNTCISDFCFIIGVSNNIQEQSTVAIGVENTSENVHSYLFGERNNVWANNVVAIGFYAQGDKENSIALCTQENATELTNTLFIQTSNATPALLGIGLAPYASGSFLCKLSVVVMEDCVSGTGLTKAWELTGVIKNIADVCSIPTAWTKTVVAADTGTTGWDITVSADNSGELWVTGELDKNLFWSGVLRTMGVFAEIGG